MQDVDAISTGRSTVLMDYAGETERVGCARAAAMRAQTDSSEELTLVRHGSLLASAVQTLIHRTTTPAAQHVAGFRPGDQPFEATRLQTASLSNADRLPCSAGVA